VFELNDEIEKDNYKELMILGEALQEKKVAEVADAITKLDKKVILIAGPSSSGKTTFANRLRIQLMVNGYDPITMSTDDYFVNREFTPIDENGDFDFESIDAVDVKQFNIDLAGLVAGELVELPTFNFITGSREYNGRTLQIHENQPIISEGIHGLNEKLTSQISTEHKFKIYISALTQLNIDDHNRIPTTDSRLIRRIVRDSKYRGHDALTTLKIWPSVRRGEERNIFPFQEEADVMFNSALSFELSILKKHAEPLLLEIDENAPEYREAKRLLKFLSYFKSIDEDELVPITSILKEFIGGSYFTE
jgi:uridine kinase